MGNWQELPTQIILLFPLPSFLILVSVAENRILHDVM
jgi:hypothetical protein